MTLKFLKRHFLNTFLKILKHFSFKYWEKVFNFSIVKGITNSRHWYFSVKSFNQLKIFFRWILTSVVRMCYKIFRKINFLNVINKSSLFRSFKNSSNISSFDFVFFGLPEPLYFWAISHSLILCSYLNYIFHTYLLISVIGHLKCVNIFSYVSQFKHKTRKHNYFFKHKNPPFRYFLIWVGSSKNV